MNLISYPIIGQEKELPFYVFGVGIQYWQFPTLREAGFEHPQILYCTKGEGKLIVDGMTYTITPNTAFYLPTNVKHEYYSITDEWYTNWIAFDGFAVEKTLKTFGLSNAAVFTLTDTERLYRILKQIHYTLRSDSLYGNYHASTFLYEYLIEFNRIINNKISANYPSSNTMTTIMNYINQNYSSEITLENLCEISGITGQHMCRLFKQHLNSRPMEYIAKKRLQEAKRLLRITHKSIAEIASAVGYNDSTYFSMIFKRYEKVTPTEYRKSKL